MSVCVRVVITMDLSSSTKCECLLYSSQKIGGVIFVVAIQWSHFTYIICCGDYTQLCGGYTQPGQRVWKNVALPEDLVMCCQQDLYLEICWVMLPTDVFIQQGSG